MTGRELLLLDTTVVVQVSRRKETGEPIDRRLLKHIFISPQSPTATS